MTPIPPQSEPGTMTQVIVAAASSVQIGSSTVLIGNAALNIILQGSLNQVWGMINNLQIVITTPLMQVNFPGNALIVYKKMILVATFDFLPTSEIYNHFWSLDDPDAFNDQFNMVGYGN